MDPQEVCRVAGLPQNVASSIIRPISHGEPPAEVGFANDLKHVPFRFHNSLWECLTDRVMGAGMCLETVRSFPTESYGPISYAGMTAPNLHDSVMQVLGHYLVLTNSGYWEKRDLGRDIMFVWHRLATSRGESAANIANILCVGCALDNIASTPEPIVRRYHFKGDKPSVGPSLECEFGVQMLFNKTEDAFIVSKEDLERPPPFAHAGMNSHFVGLLKKEMSELCLGQDLVTKLRERLSHMQDFSDVSLASLSDELNVSSRTLHRRLVAANTHFSVELDDARKARALTLVTTTNQTLVNVALSLGFSNPGAFTRAFKRWFGCSPQQLRQDPARA